MNNENIFFEIYYPNSGHTYGLEWYSPNNPELAMKFQEWCMKNIFNNTNVKNVLKPFFQGGYQTVSESSTNAHWDTILKDESCWRYIEFLGMYNPTEQQNEMVLNLVLEIEKEFGVHTR